MGVGVAFHPQIDFDHPLCSNAGYEEGLWNTRHISPQIHDRERTGCLRRDENEKREAKICKQGQRCGVLSRP